MFRPRISTTRLLAALAVTALAVTACGGGGGAAAPEASGLDGASFTVGSKEFTEQLILGEIAVQALEAAGASAELVSITGSTNVRTALTAGELDMYWEYTDPAQARMCAAAEFINRDDGLPGLEQVYGFDAEVAEVELSFIPPLVMAGQDCTFGEVTATDGAVAANNLRVLEDDQAAFVEYNVAMTLRSDIAAANPALAEVFNPIAAALTDEVMRGLNERADVGGELPDEIAGSWLTENGFA